MGKNDVSKDFCNSGKLLADIGNYDLRCDIWVAVGLADLEQCLGGCRPRQPKVTSSLCKSCTFLFEAEKLVSAGHKRQFVPQRNRRLFCRAQTAELEGQKY